MAGAAVIAGTARAAGVGAGGSDLLQTSRDEAAADARTVWAIEPGSAAEPDAD
jgi:hypothetical protein